jgi:hypothetical protein
MRPTRRVNWVRVLVPIIMIMLAIWKTVRNVFGGKERKYVRSDGIGTLVGR